MKIQLEAHEPEAKSRLTDDEYSFIFQRIPRFCLDFIFVRGRSVLLVKREIEPFKGKWSLPGGMVRYKESIDEAADRILLAELGLKPTNKQSLGYVEYPNDGPWLHSIGMVFLVQLEFGELRGSDQGHEMQFFLSLPEDVLPMQDQFLQTIWERLIE